MATVTTTSSGRARTYRFYGAGDGGCRVEIDNQALAYLGHLAGGYPKAFARALRHIGWWLQTVIKRELRAEAPGGQPFADLRDFTRRKTIELAKEQAHVPGYRLRHHRDLFSAFGALTQAIGYHSRPGQVEIGWLSPSAAVRAKKLQAGFDQPMTPKMRRMFFAAGVPVAAGKRQLKTPGRQIIRSIYEAHLPEIPERIRARVWRAFAAAERSVR